MRSEEFEIEGNTGFEFGEILGAHALEAIVDASTEVFEGSIVLVGQAFLLGELPESFDEIEVRAVGG